MKAWRILLVAAVLMLVPACGDNGTGGQAGNQDPGNATSDTTGEKPNVEVVDPTSEVTDEDTTTIINPDDDKLRVISVDPTVGPAKGGQPVTVNGTNFKPGIMTVLFGPSLASDVYVIDDTRLNCITPPGNAGLVGVTVIDTVNETSATLDYAYRYEKDILVLSVEPNSGQSTGGEPVTITGSGFQYFGNEGVQGPAIVLFGDRAAINVQVVDDNTLYATTPSSSVVGFVDVHVSNEQGTAALKNGFEYYAEPKIETVTPAAGPIPGGNSVTISGAGFVPGTLVSIGPNDVTELTFVDSNTLEAVVPAGSVGPADVTIQTPYGWANLANGYFYVSGTPPSGVLVITAQPATGPAAGGQVVTITAYGLTDVDDTTVTFGGVAAQVESVDAQGLIAIVTTPEHAPGQVDVTVSSSIGTDTLSGGYTYQPTFHILTVNPVSGPVDGGTAVTIFGAGFAAGAEVQIGALPCANVSVTSETEIDCVTPAGSPGGADVTVFQGDKITTLKNGFFYESSGMQLFVVEPDSGSRAGGTFVRLLGAGFEADAKVTFDGNFATHLTYVSSTLITAKTPPGNIGAVNVAVNAGGDQAQLVDGFTYFNPMSLYGGTWGPTVDGAVNVTILNGYTGVPIPDAFVMLYTDPDTPYQGFTNGQGQVTFSGPDVLGEQMVSASKEGFESQSVIAYDATNITIYMIPIPPPSMGPPPPGAVVTGKVFGLGKYVVAPPGNCNTVSKASLPAGLCAPCETNDECNNGTVANCSAIADTGSFCTMPCDSDADCPMSFACANIGGTGVPQCIPTPGKKQARCYITIPGMFSNRPDDVPSHIADSEGQYKVPSRLGEVAVVCLGGIVAWSDPENFTAYAFGVKRHLFVVPGENPDVNVTLNHPLTQTIKVRLDDPPFDSQIGPNYTGALVHWDFGSDGNFFSPKHQDVEYGNTGNVLKIPRQPSAWTGDVYDVTFSILGIAFTYKGDPKSQLPASYTLLRDIQNIDDDLSFKLDSGQWTVVKSGVTQTINALHGFADNDIWGVGDDGAILHFNGLGWGIQPSPNKKHLYGIWGPGDSDMWVVGEDATVLRFNGVVWTEMAAPATTADLRGVWGTSSDNLYVAASMYAGIWRWDGSAWNKENIGGADLRDIHGASADAVWAVGRNGAIRHLNGGTWQYQSAKDDNNKTLNTHWWSVHAVSATEAYAVGNSGNIIRWDGVKWTLQNTPTNRNLRAVWAKGSNDVYAVGDTGILLHFDGTQWVDQSTENVDTHALLSLWGNPESGKGVAMGASEMFMGPMLQVPYNQVPSDGGAMIGYNLNFDAKPGVPAHFHYLKVEIPSLFGDIPVWTITTDGDIFDFDLPDFANIAGTPGIAAGGYKLSIWRVYKDGFDIDNYDMKDLSVYKWRSWSFDVTMFSK
jgi:hypothetical protein